MDIVTKKQLNILIQLAEIDKHFAKVEKELILRLAKDRNFSEEEVNDLIRNPEPIDTLGALSNEQKINYLYTCLDLIHVDNKIFESELIFCQSIAIKLGFKKNVIDFLVGNFDKKLTEDTKKAVFDEYM
ncbi:MAG: TerB family tellurite resistance protein [Cyclobacteriaceae bacterium]|nr:TerB family tellurite resistance protein [Cyclobacteriaceae bacterium]